MTPEERILASLLLIGRNHYQRLGSGDASGVVAAR